MNIDQAFPSQWLKASDLRGQTASVTIANVAMEKMGEDQKLTLTFVGKSKGMVLNKTNATCIADAYGKETDGWLGRVILVYPTQCDYQGKRMACLRVRIPREQAAPAPVAAAPVEEPPPDFDPDQPADEAEVGGDAIPF